MSAKPSGVPAKKLAVGGNCYEAAVVACMLDGATGVSELVMREMLPESLVVHGVVGGAVLPGDDVWTPEHGHAWVESGDGEWVIDSSQGKTVVLPKAMYYHLGNVRRVMRYTQEQAREQLMKHGHYGPWDPHVATTPES